MPLPLRPRQADRWARYEQAPARRRISRRLAAAPEPRCLTPLHYEPEYRYPLVIWADDSDTTPWPLVRALGAISLRNHAGVAPAGRRASEFSADPDRNSRIGVRSKRIDDAISLARRKLNLHPDRHFIVGRGQSLAALVQELTDEQMQEIAGIAWIAETDSSCRPTGIDWTRRVDLPLLLCLAESELTDGTDTIAANLRGLHAIGFDVTTITSSERPSFVSNALANVNRWIMSFVTGAPAFGETETETIDRN